MCSPTSEGVYTTKAGSTCTNSTIQMLPNTNIYFTFHKWNLLLTWSTLSQYVKHTLLSALPRKFQALHAAGFLGIKFLSRWRKISLPIEIKKMTMNFKRVRRAQYHQFYQLIFEKTNVMELHINEYTNRK